MNGSLLQTVKDKPVEMTAGFVLVLAGFVSTLVPGAQSWQVGMGNVLAILGGVLLSWSTATIRTNEQAKEILKPQLEAISRHLGMASGQISRIVREVRGGVESAEEGIALIAQTTSTLYGAANDIQVMTGDKFDSKEILSTVNALEELTASISTKLSALTTSSQAPGTSDGISASLHQMQNDFASLQMQVQSMRLRVETPEAHDVMEKITCPECSSQVSWPIGNETGSSAFVSCSGCGRSFHAHRGRDGQLITRKWGASLPDVRLYEVKCPGINCLRKIPVKTQRGSRPQKRYCLGCYTKIEVTDTGDVLSSGPGKLIDAAYVELNRGEEYGHDILGCPTCQRGYESFVKQGGETYAVCPVDDYLLVSREKA